MFLDTKALLVIMVLDFVNAAGKDLSLIHI